MISVLLDLFLHMDTHLGALVDQHTIPVYALLFAVIFVETGLVVIPFLPGDSLIFVTAALIAAGGHLLRNRVERRDHILFVK